MKSNFAKQMRKRILEKWELDLTMFRLLVSLTGAVLGRLARDKKPIRIASKEIATRNSDSKY